MIKSLGLLLITLLLLGGCTQQVYEIQLTPDGDAIERRLTVWSENAKADDPNTTSPLPDQELKRIRGFYDAEQDIVEDDRHTFVGRFHGSMPADVGGAGNYIRLDSPLGATFYYSERFRGEDDLQRSIEYRYEAVDNIISLLRGWSNSEIADAAVRKRVETFLDQELRRDLKNVALYCWSHAMLSDLDETKTLERLSARLMQYFVERDYVALPDLPHLLRAINSEDEETQFALLRDIVLRKLGLDDDQALAIPADPKQVAESLRRSIRGSEIYQLELEKHQRERRRGEEQAQDKQAQSEEAFDPLGLLSGYALQATMPTMNAGRTEVRVTMHCGTPPFRTNGTWDEEQRSVQWQASIDNVNVPAMVYVGWSQPDTAAQETHFGSAILAGEALANFAIWYQGLKPAERQQWDRFLAELAPGDKLLGQIEAFEFEADENLADSARLLLTAALQPAEPN